MINSLYLTAWVLAASLWTPASQAQAADFDFQWAHKWAAGHIAHLSDVPDSDPSSFRDVFLASVQDYYFYSYSIEENRAVVFSGSGGTLQVDHELASPGSGTCPPSGVSGCAADTFTFLLGTPDAPVRLVATMAVVPYGGTAGALPHWPVNAAWAAPLDGVIHSGETTDPLGAMSGIYDTRHVRLGSPVPEPGALALLAAGLALVAAPRRVRRSRH